MPRLFLSRSTLLPRLALLAALALLLIAQFLLLAHAGEHAHHDDDADEPACALCLWQATGHSLVGPLAEPPTLALRPRPTARPRPAPAPGHLQADWPLQQAARGPPGLLLPA